MTMQLTISDINRRLRDDATAVITEAEATYSRRLDEIADAIYAGRDQSPIVLLSGPSGSGKTTTAKLLETRLDAMGCETHTLSMDDYFHSLTEEQITLAAQHQFDLESPDRVDKRLLNDQLAQFIAGETIHIPTFDFKTSQRTAVTHPLTRKPNELLILEGIHALNPAVVTLPEEQTVRLYVSVRTRLVAEDGTALHPSKIRLMRRILRDVRQRGRDPHETLRMFRSVQAGEDRYIAPYKHRATFDVNTFFAYETGVYRPPVTPLLIPLAAEPEIATLLPILAEVQPLDMSVVPPEALIREFIG